MDPYIYQYCVGGAVFSIGALYAFKQGYFGFEGRQLRHLLIAFGGLALLATLQGWLQYGEMDVAPTKPFSGEYSPQARLGTPLDYGIMVGYFVFIIAIGTWFGRGQKTTKDFFFGGQRFAWWIVAFSLVATTIGSYSFVKYSKVAFGYGIASSQTYLNDWFWLPLMLFGWLPILYFSRITSIPEYFERRFDRATRRAVTWLLLVYLVGYVGVNLFTMGKALNHLLGWDIWMAASMVASISAVYVTLGGQTSVIMTDLFQGVMLLATGGVILWLGADYVGGAEALWDNLPRDHRRAFTNFNEDASYSSVGIFWQDAMANSAMFFFLNQGLAMRFLATRSIREARRASISVMLILMPIAAAVVASGGWVGKALQHSGTLPPDVDGGRVFFITAELLAQPGVFGLIMAALTAALMSTVDTLITAVAAIVVNDVYCPSRPEATEQEKLSIARWSSIGVTLIGVALVPFFGMFESIYAAHGAFTAAITPPLVIALLFGIFWRRFTAQAAQWTIGLGSAAIIASIIFPMLIRPVAHGVPSQLAQSTVTALERGQVRVMVGSSGLGMDSVIEEIHQLAARREMMVRSPDEGSLALPTSETIPKSFAFIDLRGRGAVAQPLAERIARAERGETTHDPLLVIADGWSGPAASGAGALSGAKQFKYMRALFGLLICVMIAVLMTFITRARRLDEIRGYVWGTVNDAIAVYKGSPGREAESAWVETSIAVQAGEEVTGQANLPLVTLSTSLASALDDAQIGDLVYITDTRWWLGGLRSIQAVVGAVEPETAISVKVSERTYNAVVTAGRRSRPVHIQKLY